jgi:predicted ribosomally synthesized peptide with SipW-like signal peptide
MNKKLLISLSIIGVVAAVAIGATIAYYNDVETSTGNIFVAGTMDLKVDHVWQTYNGIECNTCSVKVYSSNNQGDMVTKRNDVAFTTPYPAVLAWKPSAWMTEASFDSSGEAKWIWEHNPTQSPQDTETNTSYSIEKTFNWMGPVTGATLDLALGSDNMYAVYLNSNKIGEGLSEKNFLSPDHITSIDASYFLQGTNVLKFVVTNKGVPGSNSFSNPAGLIYKFTINGNCGDNYFKQNCKLWGEKDLAGGDTFFNFTDVKPGDQGTNIISMHVFGNNAYGCLLVTNPVDNENGVVDSEVGDIGEPGELSQFLSAVLWSDANKNKQYDAGETILYGPAALKDMKNMNDLPLIASNTVYIGLAWCLGTQTVDGTGIHCSGTGNQDIAQTDIFLASLTAYAEQQRNNENFTCASVILP